MSAGRHIVGRAVLSRGDGCYSGTLDLFGFRYGLVVTRSGDGVLIEAYDGPAIGLYRVPLLDDEREGQS